MQQPVHLPPARHVRPHFLDDPLLRAGQFKRQIIFVKGIEIVAHAGKGDAPELPPPLLCLAQGMELDKKQLVELQPDLSRPQLLRRIGKMDIPHRLAEGHHADFREHLLGQRLGQFPLQIAQECILEVLNGAGIEERLLHPLRRVVERRQAGGDLRALLHGVDVGVGDVKCMPELGRLPEDDIIHAGLHLLLHVGQAFEPDEVERPRPVGKLTHQAPRPSLAQFVEVEYATFQLDIRHRAGNFRDFVKPASVDVFVREIEQEVFEGSDSGFFLQNFCFFRTYARQISDGTFV